MIVSWISIKYTNGNKSILNALARLKYTNDCKWKLLDKVVRYDTIILKNIELELMINTGLSKRQLRKEIEELSELGFLVKLLPGVYELNNDWIMIHKCDLTKLKQGEFNDKRFMKEVTSKLK